MFKIDDLHFYNYSYLKVHLDSVDELDNGGLYNWYYSPIPYLIDNEKPIVDISLNNYLEILSLFNNYNLSLPEKFTGFKFAVSINETQFNEISPNPFGLSSNKYEKLLVYLLEDESNRKTFFTFVSDCLFKRPFYIGKANCLRSRLRDHFKYDSKVTNAITENKLKINHIYIGYKLIPDKSNEGINRIFEEVSQRILKPSLTERPG